MAAALSATSANGPRVGYQCEGAILLGWLFSSTHSRASDDQWTTSQAPLVPSSRMMNVPSLGAVSIGWRKCDAFQRCYRATSTKGQLFPKIKNYCRILKSYNSI